jgi:hypothetical protein
MGKRGRTECEMRNDRGVPSGERRVPRTGKRGNEEAGKRGNGEPERRGTGETVTGGGAAGRGSRPTGLPGWRAHTRRFGFHG